MTNERNSITRNAQFHARRNYLRRSPAQMFTISIVDLSFRRGGKHQSSADRVRRRPVSVSVLLVFHRCFASISPVFRQYFASIPPLFRQYSAAPVFLQCSAAPAFPGSNAAANKNSHPRSTLAPTADVVPRTPSQRPSITL